MKLIVCVGSCCYSKGAQNIIDFVESNYPEIELEGSFCLGSCAQGISVSYNGNISHVSKPKEIENIIKELK